MLTDDTTRDQRHRAGAPRLLLHAAAEVPLVVFGAIELARGWRPLFDNASIALRSYQVFSRQSPLVGHQVALSGGSTPVFSPGPLQNWLLAVPVRIDPGQGALWGAVLCAVIGVALAIEAGWSTARWWGAVVVTAAALTLFAVRGEIAADVLWNEWFGLIFVITTLATGWAVASGHLRWWPVTVIAASVAAQCQEVNTLAVVMVCGVSPVLGVLANRLKGTRIRTSPLLVGVVVGLLAWSAPVVQQLRGHPGNLSLLWRTAHQPGPKVDLSQALGALGAGLKLIPEWVHAPPIGGGYAGFVYVVDIFGGPRWWAVATLVLLIVIGTIAWTKGHVRMVGATAVSFVAAVGCLLSFAAVPESQFLTFEYLGALVIPIAMAVWLTFGWAFVGAARPVLRWASRTVRAPDDQSETVETSRGRTTVPVVALGATIVAVAFGWSLASGLSLMGTDLPTGGGWSAVRVSDAGTAAVARVAPRMPFRLELVSHLGDEQFSVLTGTAYLLDTEGFQARLGGPATTATYGAVSHSMPVVVLTVARVGGGVSASILDPDTPGTR